MDVRRFSTEQGCESKNAVTDDVCELALSRTAFFFASFLLTLIKRNEVARSAKAFGLRGA